MNKKGFAIYPIGLVVVVIISWVLLVNAMSAKLNLPQQLGAVQQTVLQSTADMRLSESYLQTIANYAGEKSELELPNHPSLRTLCPYGYIESTDSTGRPVTCPIINNPQDPRETCMPDLFSIYPTIFNENLQPYIQRYNNRQTNVELPETGYELMFLERTSALISTNTATITLRDGYGVPRGYATFRPALKTYLPGHAFFEMYTNFIQPELKDTAIFCYDAEDREACIKETTTPHSGKQPEQINNQTYLLYFPVSPTHCFGVTLPGTNSS